MTDPTHCDRCSKPAAVCICDRVEPVETRLHIIVLRHPQEDDQLLGTAPLLALALPRTVVRTGLSWPSLKAATGRDDAEPARWAVLAGAKPPGPVPPAHAGDPVILMDRHGKLRPLARHGLEGIIVLDGTWSQAKTLWWRNAWLLKLNRLLLAPREPSMYGKLRRAPRREWVSTLEAVADVLPALGEPQASRDSPRRLMRTLLQRIRDRRLDTGPATAETDEPAEKNQD